MNKIFYSAVLACGLLLLDSPEATAHEARVTQERWSGYDRADYGRRDYYARDSYRRDHRGSKYKRDRKIPYWLKHDRSFRHWYARTRVNRNRHLSWHQLFDIYRWERRYTRHRHH